MKKCFLLNTLIVVLLSFFSQNTLAQELNATDFFGKWHFSANLEITNEGESLKSEFSNDYDVIIASNSVYEMMVTGVGGGTEGQPINKIDNTTHELNVINPNGNTGSLWPHAAMTSIDGKSPWGTEAGKWRDSYNNVKWTFDPATKDITIPDFAAVALDYESDYPTVYAKFTNCKLTLVSADVKEVTDISADYKFTAVYYDETSSFPSSFMINLTSTSATYETYNATISIDGYNEVVVPATWDGYNLALTFDNTYLNDEKTVAFSAYGKPENLQTTWKFKQTSDKVFSMDSDIGISRKEGDTFVKETEFYWAGNLVKQVESTDRSGTYTLTAESFGVISEDEADKELFKQTVTMTLKFDENSQKYFVTELMGFDTFSANYGGIPCNETSDGGLEIDITGGYNYLRTISQSEDYMESVYDKLYNGIGDTNSPIKMTFDENGVATVDGMIVVREKVTYDESWNVTITPLANIAYWGNLKGGIAPLDYSGTYTVTPAVFELYDSSMSDKFKSSFDVKVKFDEGTQKYYITEFMGFDTNSMNYGGIPCIETEDGLEIDIASGYNFLEMVSMTDDYMEMVYLKLFDGDNKQSSPVKMTFNSDGTAELGNFYVDNVKIVYDSSWNAVETDTPIAYYGSVASGIKNVNIQKSLAADKAYDLSGRRVNNSQQRGILIINGRKYIFK